MKTFKHKKTGEIATYRDGVMRAYGVCIETGVEPSAEFWDEIIPPVRKADTFITEDGVAVGIGRVLCYVHTSKYERGYCSPDSPFYLRHQDELKLFSTEEAADHYILMNAQCLSIKDLQNVVTICNRLPMEFLKQLVKSRL